MEFGFFSIFIRSLGLFCEEGELRSYGRAVVRFFIRCCLGVGFLVFFFLVRCF